MSRWYEKQNVEGIFCLNFFSPGGIEMLAGDLWLRRVDEKRWERGQKKVSETGRGKGGWNTEEQGEIRGEGHAEFINCSSQHLQEFTRCRFCYFWNMPQAECTSYIKIKLYPTSRRNSQLSYPTYNIIFQFFLSRKKLLAALAPHFRIPAVICAPFCKQINWKLFGNNIWLTFVTGKILNDFSTPHHPLLISSKFRFWICF